MSKPRVVVCRHVRRVWSVPLVVMGPGGVRSGVEYFNTIVRDFLLIWAVLSPLVGCPSAAQLLEYRFSEEQPADSLIGNVLWDYGLSTTYSAQELSLMRLQFRRTDGNYQYFRVEEATGILRSNQVIDRESVCPNSASCDIRLDLVVGPPKYFHIVKVVVFIDDINDQTPSFRPDTVTVEMSESARPGSLVALNEAVDGDGLTYGVQRYELTPPMSPFELKVTPHRDGTSAIQLCLKDVLDRETLDSYYLLVTAFDGGNPPKQGQLRVNVTVVDANDNAPRFDSSNYRVNVSESLPSGSLVLTVHATDIDVGWNALVFYSFASYTESLYGDVFAIDNVTGQITTKVPLRYRIDEDVIHLRVTAVDGGSSPNSAFTRVTVRIVDTNDNAPEVTISTLIASGQAEVEEHASIGTFLAHVVVRDIDKNEGGRVSCEVQPTTDFFIESVYQNEYTLRTAKIFDRETDRGPREATLTCQDHGSPPMSSTLLIPVAIIDINDHSPQIQDSYKVSITENNAIGTVLLRLNATDEDSGRNAELRYEMDRSGEAATDQVSIVVDPETGEVAANVVFNYEWRRIYTQRVSVCDRGDTPRCASTLLTVEVLDVNDEPPIFSRAIYYFEVTENQVPGTIVGMVSADDADVNVIYRKIVYTMRGCEGFFEVDPVSGELRTLRSLDREEQSIFRATVTASNEDFPSLKTAANLVIEVNDENDNSPSVIHPADRDPMIQIPCRAPPGMTVVKIQATDPDDGPAGTVTYFLTTNSNFTPLFEINPQTGVVSVSSSIPYSYECSVHWLTIRITDNGIPKRSTNYDIFINLNASVLPVKAEMNLDQATSGLTSSKHDYVIIFPTLALGVVLLVLAVVCFFLLFRYYKRKQKKRKQRDLNIEAHVQMTQHRSMSRIELQEMNRLKARSVSRHIYGSSRIETYMHSDTESDSGCSASDESDKKITTVASIDI